MLWSRLSRRAADVIVRGRPILTVGGEVKDRRRNIASFQRVLSTILSFRSIGAYARGFDHGAEYPRQNNIMRGFRRKDPCGGLHLVAYLEGESRLFQTRIMKMDALRIRRLELFDALRRDSMQIVGLTYRPGDRVLPPTQPRGDQGGKREWKRPPAT